MPVAHYENFPVASLLLPARLREPIEAIYTFARTADDIADEGDAPTETRVAALQALEHSLARAASGEHTGEAMIDRLGAAMRGHALPLDLFRALLSAFTQDTQQTDYATYDELLDYCERSANPIGHLLLILFDSNTPATRAQSDAICTSLQLINFWQDVAIDWGKPRIYLPREDRERFGVTLDHLRDGRVDRAFRDLMRFEVERTRALMHRGAPLVQALSGRAKLEIAAVVEGGLCVLEKIEQCDFDVFSRRPVLRRRDWIRVLWRALRACQNPRLAIASHP